MTLLNFFFLLGDETAVATDIGKCMGNCSNTNSRFKERITRASVMEILGFAFSFLLYTLIIIFFCREETTGNIKNRFLN